jgi:uncharacterized protein (DUF302 family)
MKTNQLKFPALLFAVMLMAGILGFSKSIQAQSIKPVTVKSSKSFDETIDAIKKAVSGGGMMVLSEINQGKIMEMSGMKMNAESLFIGNPTVGKQAFDADPSVGLAIPVRINVYESNGVTYINYFKPSNLFPSGNKKLKMIGETLDGKLAMMLKMVAM